MGYFEGLAEACFKKDEVGRTVFYPFGVLAKGRVLSDEVTETRVRGFLIRYYKITLPTTILLAAFHKWALLIAIALASFVWFYVFCQKTTAHLPISESKLTLREGYTSSAKAHNKVTLWILFATSILFVAGGLVLTIVAPTVQRRLIGLACLGCFSLCMAAIGFMLKAKYKAG